MSSLNIDSFIAGVTAALKLSRISECPTADVEEKMVKAFRVLDQIASRKGVELRFYCSLNPYDNSCATVRYALLRAQQSGVVRRDGQALKILVEKDDAAGVIESSPFSLTEWKMIINSLKPEPVMSSVDLEELKSLHNF